ncbi:hypothetical protein [Paenibacillus sp. MBLB4367]|uniref:hypothetical protein n=1 Tax=Paenibacillus sp. MBLB4367 TaxID=3384767 RepID=UPI0039081251
MKGQAVKVINGLRYNGARSNLASINAYSVCLQELGSPYAFTPWLYGATGIPFLFRTGDDVNTAPVLHELPYGRMVAQLQNLGVQVEGVSAVAEGETLDRLRRESWEACRIAIGSGFPCFGRGFVFNGGETSIVQGYDDKDAAYICSCWNGTTTVEWQSLGERDGLVDIHWMRRNGQTEENVRKTVADALQLAVEFAAGKLTGPQTYTGNRAYRRWSAELRKGAVDGWFFAYNTHEWDTCRSNGYKFLLKAKERLGSETPEALERAIESFGLVRDRFHRIYELFPWEQPRGLIEDTERRLEAAALLEEADAYDSATIAAFREVVEALNGGE